MIEMTSILIQRNSGDSGFTILDLKSGAMELVVDSKEHADVRTLKVDVLVVEEDPNISSQKVFTIPIAA